MKRIILFVALVGAVLLPTQSAKAILGLGINVGQDSYALSGETYSNLFGVSGINLVREDMAKPLGIGAYLYLDIIPIVDLELGFDLYGNTYNYTFDNPVSGDQIEEDLAWVRSTTWVSVQKTLFKLPMIKLYAGGGLNFNASAPIVTQEFMEDFLGSQDATLDPEDLLDEIAMETGFHAEVGLRIKPVLVPFSIHARYRQTFVEGIVPGENTFSTIMIGGGIKF